MKNILNHSNPFIKTLSSKKLIGLRMNMSFEDNKTYLLWKSLMPRRKEIIHPISSDLISMQIYQSTQDFNYLTLKTTFEKWAAVEVSKVDHLPEGMETFIIPEGLYAVFQYKGNINSAAEAFRHIFETWLPSSGYAVDTRPHFEVLGEKYNKDSDDSEEDIWIPIKAL